MATEIGTATSTVTVNAAFLQEIKEANAELWQLLENLRPLCAAPAAIGEHVAQVVDMLMELRDQLALHFALEEAYGYFEDPIWVATSQAEQAIRLRAEHRQLYAAVSHLADQAQAILCKGDVAEFVARIPGHFVDFDRQLKRHECSENELIMRQFDDIGVGD